MLKVPKYTIGGTLVHSAKGTTWSDHKYTSIETTKSGKKRYIYKSMNEVGDANNRRKLREMSDEDLVNEINKLEEAKRFYVDEEGTYHVARKNDKYAKQVYREGFYRELGDYLEDKEQKRKNKKLKSQSAGG